MLLSLIEGDPAVTNGLSIGTLTGLVFFIVTWWMVSCVVRGNRDKRINPRIAKLSIAVFILKFPLLGLALWLAFKHLQINPVALICGIAVTQSAIIIPALVKSFAKQESL